MGRTKQILLILFTLLFSSVVYAQPVKKLIFSAPNESTNAISAYVELLKQAYKELGYDVELKRLPTKRGYAYTNDGQLDGLVLSTKRILQTYKNIIVVNVPLTRIELSVFTTTKEFEVTGMNSLKPYKVGIVRGYPATVRLTQKLDRQIVNSYDSLFSILQHGRVDVALVIKSEAQRFLAQRPEFKDVKALEPALFVLQLYHFLNKKHESLALEVTPIIEDLIKAKLLEELYKPYLPNP